MTICLVLLGGHQALVGGLAHRVDVGRQILHPAFLNIAHCTLHIVKLTGNTDLKHVSDLLGVNVEVLARVDGDDGGAGKCLDEVVDISLPQSV